MKLKMLLLKGLPGSGKSTFAKEYQEEHGRSLWYRINWDMIRRAQGLHLEPFSRKKEEAMQKFSMELAADMVSAGMNLIIDNTNMNPSTVNKWRVLAENLDMEFSITEFNTSVEACIRNDSARRGKEGFVGRAVIEYRALQAGKIWFPPYRKIVIVDMDGTLADCTHRRHFVNIPCGVCGGSGQISKQDVMAASISTCEACRSTGRAKHQQWDKFESYDEIMKDPPFQHVVDLVNVLYESAKYTICILSGRKTERAGIATADWLGQNGVKYHHLFMRNRDGQDWDIKQELLGKFPKEQIAFVLDDRQQVVDMWRRNGIPCLQVAPGNF